MHEIAVVLGTRAEIIKMAPVICALERRGLDPTLIFTGQHFDKGMSYDFLAELDLPDFDYDLKACYHGMNYAEVIGSIMAKLEPVLNQVKPRLVLAQGDTNSTAAAIFTSLKKLIPCGHIEAGLRSFDMTMPEESNRILADHSSQLLFAPTEISAINLTEERIDPQNIFITGNTIVDACMKYFPSARKSDIVDRLNLDSFVVLSVHRKENMTRGKLKNVIDALGNLDLAVVFLLHPLTKLKLTEYGLMGALMKSENILPTDGISYFDTLKLVWESRFVITDSGGLQEECLILDTPCITLRANTERPETLRVNNVLCETDAENILKCIPLINVPDEKEVRIPNILGDGRAAERIVKIVEEKLYGLKIPKSAFQGSDYYSPSLLMVKEKRVLKELNHEVAPGYVVGVYRNNRAIFPQDGLLLEGGDIVRIIGRTIDDLVDISFCDYVASGHVLASAKTH